MVARADWERLANIAATSSDSAELRAALYEALIWVRTAEQKKQHRLASQLEKVTARTMLLYTVWVAARCPRWTFARWIEETKTAYPDDPRLKVTPRSLYADCRRVLAWEQGDRLLKR